MRGRRIRGVILESDASGDEDEADRESDTTSASSDEEGAEVVRGTQKV